MLLILVDATDPEAGAQIEVTEALLRDLGAGEKPVIYAFNKCDLGAAAPGVAHGRRNIVYISAATGQGVDRLLLRIEELLHADKRRVTFFFPNAKQGLLSGLYKNATVEDVEYGAEGVRVTAVVDERTYGPLRAFDVAPKEDTQDEW